jgi:hypothetical protein
LGHALISLFSNLDYNHPVLPLALFKPFAAPAAEAHLRLLADLYAESRRAAQPLSRDLVLDIIIHHTIASHTKDDPLPAALDTLRHLQDCGWVRLEVQPDFSQACVLTPRAFQILQILQSSPPSIPQLLITIYDLLKAALLDVDNEARLDEAARLTDQLIDGLKSIQHSADEAGPLPDTIKLRAAIVDAAYKLETRGHAPARHIREQFAALDRLLADITARRAQLAAADSQPSSAAPRLAALLSRLSTLDKKTFAKHTAALIHLSCQPQQSQISNSLVSKSPVSPFVSDEASWLEPSAEEIESARREIQKQLDRPLNPDRIRRLARAFLDGKPEARVSELVAEGKTGLSLVIHLRLHGDGALGYTLEDLPWIETNGLVFRDFMLKNPDYVPPLMENVEEEISQPENLAFAKDNDNGDPVSIF